MSEIILPAKRKVYYHRSVVPKHLKRLLMGRAQIWRSLDTNDLDEARARSAAWDARVQRLFVALKKDGNRMTEQEREALVAHWLESELDYAEDCRVLAGPISDDHRESQLEGLSIMYDDAHEALLGNDFRNIAPTADALLKAAGLPSLNHTGVDFRAICNPRVEYSEKQLLHRQSSE